MKTTQKVFLALIFCALLITVASMFREHALAQGLPASNAGFKYIATATTTTVKPAPGFLHSVTINGGTAGVVTLYDITGTGCTGTPASGKFATIETIGATNPVTLTYDLATLNGICVVTAAATDLTVTFN
jgi:hypothetical protein